MPPAKQPWTPPKQDKTLQEDVDPKTLKSLRADFNELARLKQQKDDLKKEMGELEIALGEQEEKCFKLLDGSGMRNVNLSGIGMFYKRVDIYPRVLEQDALFADLRKRQRGDLIKETVHPQTLKAAVLEMRENMEKPLDGVEVFEKQAIGFRREGSARSKKA